MTTIFDSQLVQSFARLIGGVGIHRQRNGKYQLRNFFEGVIMIRPVRDDELAAVLRLWHAAGVTPPSVSDSIEGLTRLIHEPAALLLVATIDNQIVGSVIGGWDGWRGNIYRLAVAPEFRRKGIARRLVAEIRGELFAKGATRLSALVEHEHQWAIDFWDSMSDLGYQRDPKFARYVVDRG